MKFDAIIINEQDNVATALVDLEYGKIAVIGLGQRSRKAQINERIPYGHKFAVRDIEKGEDIIKYGEIIGRATKDIGVGRHAHIQNIESLRGRGDLEAQE